MKKEDDERYSRDKFSIILLTLILFMLCVMIIIMLIPRKYCCINQSSELYQNGNAAGGVDLTVDSNEEGNSKVENRNDDQGVAISGITALTFPVMEKEVDVDFYNPEKNADMFYQTFELRLIKDSGYETLYTSGLVEPGKRIEHITLCRGLAAGVYQAVVHVQPYRMDEDRTPTNNADIKTELIVR